ncbi:hypothetical protein WJX84_002313 [Apatococcus fuscideae]|uniref:Uncharacterized protein n=1 Tax=Apatococcus fuscideae TaxID=2026836 RepID=A0AAW1T060_9CHLO
MGVEIFGWSRAPAVAPWRSPVPRRKESDIFCETRVVRRERLEEVRLQGQPVVQQKPRPISPSRACGDGRPPAGLQPARSFRLTNNEEASPGISSQSS